ncbi:MBL fold metallo-hydrolase [Saccharopolyspora sp. 5N708]|uniref:MBL fold metallo-hydrolase n=1 Tax=Saccharopolyspora sp. 5N708 TaxID=3457424 RepID=UPI003FD11DFB
MGSSQLSYAVYVAESVPTTVTDLPPGLDRRMWSPTAATLIAGERDAVLVDPLFTVKQAEDLVAWLAISGKNLTTVYVTHGHGDHWFGLGAVLDRFPGARAVAVPKVVEQMRAQSTPAALMEVWETRFPGQIPRHIVLADPLEGTLELEGHELVPIELGHTDSDDTTCLHVPSAGLVVAGDAAYNNVHLYLAGSDEAGRRDWLHALDRIEGLQPRAVVAGHKDPSADDDPGIISETRQYIRTFEEGVANTSTALDLYHYMIERYPARINRGALWGSVQVAKG